MEKELEQQAETFEEKLKWFKSVELKEFIKPMKYSLPDGRMFSEEYIRDTPLSKLKEEYEKLSFLQERDKDF